MKTFLNFIKKYTKKPEKVTENIPSEQTNALQDEKQHIVSKEAMEEALELIDYN